MQWSNDNRAILFAGQAEIRRSRRAAGTVYTLKARDGANVAVNRRPVNEMEIRHGDVLWHEGKSFIFHPDHLRAKPNGASITVCGLNVRRGGHRRGQDILRNLSVPFPADSFTAVMGPSGCGKTTFMNCIIAAGECGRPRAKAVRIDGDCARPRIGFVPQDDVVYPLLTVLENLEYAATIRLPDQDPDTRRKQVGWVIESLDLQHRKDHLANSLSGGERKRLSIGIELVGRPQVLILDEPTNGLDPKTSADLLDRLEVLARAGHTVICVTHDLEVLKHASHLVLLRTLAKASDTAASSLAYHGPSDEEHLRENLGIAELRDLYAWANSGENHRAPWSEYQEEDGTVLYPAAPDKTPFGKKAALGWRVFSRSFLALRRSLNSFFSTLLTPLALVLLVYYGARLKALQPHCLFLAVSAVWVGMSLAIREVVGESQNYVRDLRAGMPSFSHLYGKITYCLLGTLAQAVILATTIWVLEQFGGRPHLSDVALASPFLLLTACWLASATGAMCGLSISSFSATENMAVNLMPIMLIPNLLFSSYIIKNSDHRTNSAYTEIWANRISALIPSEHLSIYFADGEGQVKSLLLALILLLFWMLVAATALTFRHALARKHA